MRRCLQLAALAAGNVAPNPMVGAVLVYEDRIIGEGYHRQYGGAHAEVACVASVAEADRPLIPQATLYVSLEPCAHWGKTPPCADLIMREKISTVVVGCRDPFPLVNGKGLEKLQAAGVKVVPNVLEEDCKRLNKRFFAFHAERRPYVVLKWAQSSNQKIGSLDGSRILISNAYTNRLVHKWRSEEAGIVVGTNTALHDDPQLTLRHWPGRHPVRIVPDMNLRLPSSLNLFDGTAPTIVFNKHRHSLPAKKISPYELTGVNYYQATEDVSLVQQMLNGLYRLGIQSILVEGGPQLLQSFIDEGAWDEARIITNEDLVIANGLPAPRLSSQKPVASQQMLTDRLQVFRNAALDV